MSDDSYLLSAFPAVLFHVQRAGQTALAGEVVGHFACSLQSAQTCHPTDLAPVKQNNIVIADNTIHTKIVKYKATFMHTTHTLYLHKKGLLCKSMKAYLNFKFQKQKMLLYYKILKFYSDNFTR
jgi:hypothetical protein